MILKNKQTPRIKKQIGANEFLAYTAGFFDGEGCLHKHSKRGHYRIHIGQACEEPLKTFCKRFNVGTVRKSRNGIEEHHKDIYQWQFGRQIDIKLFLEMILPYLVVKKIPAENAIKEISAALDKIEQ